MKREIKFRAYHKRLKKFFPVLSLGLNGSHVLGIPDEPTARWGVCEPDEVEVVQYTGLKDKNGKDIYEGDIVKHQWRDEDIQITQIVWKDGGFTYENTRYDYEGLLYPEEWEVIGNIYENGDLLEK